MKRTKRTSSSSMVVGEDDIISKLPDALIIHILSFLPTEDAVRTSLLSKRWRPIWYSVPTLFFSKNTKWKQGNEDKLFEFYNNCLKYRKNVKHLIVNSDITSFKLDIDGYYQTSKAGFVDKWLGFAVENKVKEICLSIGQEDLDDDDDDVIDYSEICYCLPKILGNARYLTILELNGVFLDTSYSFSFPSLKTLSMEDVYHLPTAKEDGVVKFLLGCPSLERLWLHDYKFLGIDSHHRLQSLSLKFMEIVFESFMNDAQIQVEAMNLESLVVECNIFDMIDFSSCKKIRNLSLIDVYIGNEYLSSFEALISNIPLIENLVLSKCDLLQSEHLTISSLHLKSFHIKNCDYSDDGDEMKVVTIEHASKLAYICYEGNLNFTILMEPSNLLNGKIIIHKRLEDYGAKWFIDMLTFLVNLSCYWNSVTLEVANCKNLNLCRYPLLNWKHLRVITDCKPEEESDLKEDLMWISPSLETLSINEKVIF
ncbi:F-box/FBD/LRR-repeat protein At3g26920-like isoform X2 [Cannabis sativa]|uniref:F-box/FBD/LRR-repeat protein At3g26920-like isoform X2 n=1 Tax=Cannabis sativa TaxID=3483 RepID=UPI0029CA248A|nr:F-box/FBD/LRR-repeat protein At3g26920-like isoform X2 [Cannabis sativa]